MAQLSNSVERFADVAEICSEFKTSEEALQMLRRFEHASGELDLIAPCLSLLVGRGWKDVDSEVLRLCNRLANHRGSVFVRRTALQTLSKLVRREEDSGWRQFFVIMDALEHSQFHLAAPSLPLIDILLSRCTDETRKATELSWYWVRLVFQRGLEHCKGWIRFWTARKFLSVQPAIMANDFSAIFELLLPIMSEYDIYWRMDREGCFDDFLSSLISFLTCCVRPLDNTTLARFCQSVLEFLITVKEPSAMIFLSQTFSKLPHVDALELDDDGMFRKLLSSTESLREPQFKPVISANLFKLYINMLKWSESTIWTVASIVRYPYESIFRDLLYSEGFQNYWDSFVTLLSPNISAFELIDLYLEKAKSTQFGYFSTAVVASRLSCILNLEESVASEISDRLTQMWTQGEHKRVEFALLIQLTASVQQKALVVRKANDVFTEYLDIFCESAEGNVDEFRLFNNALKSQMKLLSAENHRWLMKALNILQTDVSPCRRSLLLLIALSDSMRNYSCKGCSHISSVKRYFDQCLPQLVPNPTLSKNSDDHVFVEDAGISIDDEVVSCNFLLLKKFADALFLDWDFLFEECLIAMEKQSAVKSILAIVALMTDIIVKVTSIPLVISGLQKVDALVNGFPRSSSYMVVAQSVLQMCLQEELMENPLIQEKIMASIGGLIVRSSVVTRHGVFLSETLMKATELFSPSWVCHICRLISAVPPVRKSDIAMNRAYEYACSGQLISSVARGSLDQLRFANYHTRLNVLHIAIKMVQRGTNFIQAWVNEICRLSEDLLANPPLSRAQLAQRNILQILVVLIDYLDFESENSTFELCLKHFVGNVLPPFIVVLLELILVRLFLKNVSLFNEFIDRQQFMASERVGCISLWITVIMHTVKALNSKDWDRRFFRLILPWCTANHFVVRCTALASLLCAWRFMPTDVKVEFDYLSGTITHISEHSDQQTRVISNLCKDFFFAKFDVNRHYDLQTVFDILSRKTNLPDIDCIPADFLQRYYGLSTYNGIRVLNTDPEFMNAPSSIVPSDTGKKIAELVTCSPATTFAEGDACLQRKCGFKGKAWRRSQEASVILVASLIQFPANLGGLCRTCEAFGVDTFVIGSEALLNNQTFQSLSMNSEKWINIETVPGANLGNYMEGVRKRGYKVIAAEQTTVSVPLNKFHFPAKSVILLGNEREGLPGEIFRYVDYAVEIPQIGQTKSLNVHVSGALFMYKYFNDNTVL